MKTCKWLLSQFAPLYPDRVFLFVFLYLLAAFAVAIEFGVFDELHFLLSGIYAATHFAFAVFIASRNWKSWAQWLGIALIVIVNVLLYAFVSAENYLEADRFMRRSEIPRDHLIQYTLAGSLLTFVLIKLGRHVSQSRLGRYLSEHRVRVLMVLTGILLGSYYVLLGFDLRFPNELKTEYLGTYWFWLFFLPCFFVLPSFFIGRVFHSWWKYSLAMVALISCLATIIFTYAMQNRELMGMWLAGFGIAFFVSTAFILRSPKAKLLKKYRPNLVSFLLFGSLVLLSFTVPRYLDIASLCRSEDSNRWQYAYEVAKLKSLRSTRVKFQRHVEEEFDWPNDWFEVEWDLEDGHEKWVAEHLPKRLDGTLTIKNMRTDIDLSPLGTVTFDLLIEQGRMSTRQFEFLRSQSRRRPLMGWAGATGPANLVLIDVEVINPPSFQFSGPTYIQFESNQSSITTSTLRSLTEANFQGNSIVATINHKLSDEQWTVLSEFSKIQIIDAAFPNFKRQCFVAINSEQPPAISHDWFDNVPFQDNSRFFLWFHFPDSNLEQMTEAQIRLILDSQHRISVVCGEDSFASAPIPQSQHQLAWDLRFASNQASRFSCSVIDGDMLTDSLVGSKLQLANDYHWYFDTNPEDKRNQENLPNGLLLPDCDQKLLDYVCSHADIDSLALTYAWAGSATRGYDNPTSLSVVGKLKNLKQLVLSASYDITNLSWLKHLDQLEYLEFHPEWRLDDSDLEFVGPCPNLKTVVIHREEPVPLIEKLIDLPSMQKVVLILDEYFAPEADEYWTEYAKEYPNASKVEVVVDDNKEYPSQLYQAFQRHRAQVREQVREKYLPK